MNELPMPGDMTGRTVIITGGSSGIGAAAARALSALGAQIAVVGRNPARTQQVADSVGGNAFLADFGKLAAVRELADELLERYPDIHVLADNAGGMQRTRALTADRNERTVQETHLSGMLLTSLLLPRISQTATRSPEGSVRIVQTASAANLMGRISLDDLDTLSGPWADGWRAYGRAKLANILFAQELARRTEGTGVRVYSFHPGLVRTRFGSGAWSMSVLSAVTFGHYGLSAEQGAEPLVRLASADRITEPSGTYWDRLKPNGLTAPQAKDAAFARAFWKASEARLVPR
ncbi:SDR family NAD(P)-dependent oxidoreductase [Naasia lichenicola]|nr:SDR family NAD(P)-dependent oxidoreductase [Naasia lichenicola]